MENKIIEYAPIAIVILGFIWQYKIFVTPEQLERKHREILEDCEKKYTTQAETRNLIQKARKICGEDCEITIDTVEKHYWNYKIDPKQQDKSWGDSIYTDFHDFNQASLKMCVEIFDEKAAEKLRKDLSDCDCVRFSDGYWYKFTKKTATKENAILHMCTACGIDADDIIAFGDDYADIGMLKLCGVGVAMGNAIDEVKQIADYVIGNNDNDGIGKYLQNYIKK